MAKIFSLVLLIFLIFFFKESLFLRYFLLVKNYDQAYTYTSSEYEKGVVAYKSGDYPAASLHFSESQQKKAAHNLGNAFMKLYEQHGDEVYIQQAITSYKRAMEQYPNTHTEKNLQIAQSLLKNTQQKKSQSEKNERSSELYQLIEGDPFYDKIETDIDW